MEYRSNPKGNTRQLIDYQNIIDSFDEEYIVCINKGIWEIARVLVGTRGLYRTTYVIDRDSGGYFIPDILEFEPIERAIAHFLGSDDMSCDIVAGLAKIEDAIRKLRVGCNVTVRQSIYDGERWGGSIGTVVPRPTTFGGTGEFPTKQAFDTHLCDKANWLFEGFINAVGTLSALSLYEAIAGSVGLAIIGVAFMSNPPVATLTALAIAVGVSFALSSFIAGLQEYLVDHRQEFVCAIYESPSAESAYDAIDSLIDAGLAYLGLAVGQEAMAIVLMSFIDVDTISQAYADGALPMATSPVECNCGLGEYLFDWEDFDLEGWTIGDHTGTTPVLDFIDDHDGEYGDAIYMYVYTAGESYMESSKPASLFTIAAGDVVHIRAGRSGTQGNSYFGPVTTESGFLGVSLGTGAMAMTDFTYDLTSREGEHITGWKGYLATNASGYSDLRLSRVWLTRA